MQHSHFLCAVGSRVERSQVPSQSKKIKRFLLSVCCRHPFWEDHISLSLFKNSAVFPANSCLPKTTSTRPLGCVSILLCRTDPLAKSTSQCLLTVPLLDSLAWRLGLHLLCTLHYAFLYAVPNERIWSFFSKVFFLFDPVFKDFPDFWLP